MATLHLLSHSPFTDSCLSSCLRLLGEGDALLLSGDAVHALVEGTAPCEALECLPDGVALFALAEDVQARGLKGLPPRASLLDYPDFVDLCCRYARVNSWL